MFVTSHVLRPGAHVRLTHDTTTRRARSFTHAQRRLVEFPCVCPPDDTEGGGNWVHVIERAFGWWDPGRNELRRLDALRASAAAVRARSKRGPLAAFGVRSDCVMATSEPPLGKHGAAERPSASPSATASHAGSRRPHSPPRANDHEPPPLGITSLPLKRTPSLCIHAEAQKGRQPAKLAAAPRPCHKFTVRALARVDRGRTLSSRDGIRRGDSAGRNSLSQRGGERGGFRGRPRD